MLEAIRSSLASSSDVTALYAGEDHVTGLVGPCLVLIARREPDDGIVVEAPKWVDRLLAAHPKKGGLVVVVQASAPPPSDVARKRIDRAYGEYGRGVVAGAMVIEGRGFMAASIRSALSLMMLTSRYSYPIKTFATPREGAAFVCGRLPGGDFHAASLVAGIEQLRSAYEARVGVFSSAAG